MEAEDIRSGQTVAVYPHPIGPEQHEHFLDTARVLAGVRHANVIDVHDFGVENDIAYLVTEFVEGATLAESSRLPFTAFVSVVRQIALGLGALHEQGVAHGRLTPQSLLMSPDGTVRITHFEPVQDRGNDESKDLEALGHLLEDLGVEDAPEELRKFEGAFRSRLDGAVRLLLSPDADSQSRALKLLRTTSFGASASETAPLPPSPRTDTATACSARCGSNGATTSSPTIPPRNRPCCPCCSCNTAGRCPTSS